ncbi:MAG: protein kinase domain-containing protein [Planctomycetota bacterium]
MDPTASTGASTISGPRRWIPVVATAVILCGIGMLARWRITEVLRESVADDLQALLTSQVGSLERSANTHRTLVRALAEAEVLNPGMVAVLRRGTDGSSANEMKSCPELAALRKRLGGLAKKFGYEEFILATPDGMNAGAQYDCTIGINSLTHGQDCLKSVAEKGEAVLSLPYLDTLAPDENGRPSPRATMFAAAPVRANNLGPVIGVLALRIDPHDFFEVLLDEEAQRGASGETYAFNEEGLMLSGSRFPEDLEKAGLLSPGDSPDGMLAVKIRDPGVSLPSGAKPALPRREQPFTRMARSALNGESSYDVDGYLDYRGVPVVGAWRWMDSLGIGVATEMDHSDAFRPTLIVERAFLLLALLFIAAGAGVAFYNRRVASLERHLDRAERKMQRLGQYTLVSRIGAGAMGEVYLAKHALLRRPTAVKLLPPERTSHIAVTRFEREVQMTARLTSPNTIAIYDYGRTDEGVFYYAMEHLQGLPLDALVEMAGPLPAARVIHILLQACDSLAEAHDSGLIHRDIKPANMLLCRRGGIHDVVKVLDFGLVKDVRVDGDGTETVAGSIAGTPLYLSPEGASTPSTIDRRADLYSLAAVGYFLLSGKHLFDAGSLMDILFKQMGEMPEKPSVRGGVTIDEDLEAVIMKCLEKSPDDRYADARGLADALRACSAAEGWNRGKAAEWWMANAADLEKRFKVGSKEPEMTIKAHRSMDIDLHSRGTISDAEFPVEEE